MAERTQTAAVVTEVRMAMAVTETEVITEMEMAAGMEEIPGPAVEPEAAVQHTIM